jgi:hypothetical protein
VGAFLDVWRTAYGAERVTARKITEGRTSIVTSALPDPSLTLTRTQQPAIVSNTGNKRSLIYAGFANPCNPQQRLTAHS